MHFQHVSILDYVCGGRGGGYYSENPQLLSHTDKFEGFLAGCGHLKF